jgi:hypothetical protein
MKKVLSFVLLGFMLFLGLSFSTVKADDDLIHLYPYDQEACLLATPACSYTKVGNSNWSFTYYGHRYYVIKDLVRYGHEMIDDNSDGWIDDNELAGIPYNAFASVFMNNTDSQIDILTLNARTDITDVVHRKYAHFDELGVLQMFEDHISLYYIYNDGDATTPDWRMATQTEIDAYKAEVAAGLTSGQPSADGKTRFTHIRIALDDTDTDGHVVEPLGYLKWTNADVDTATETDKTKWSTIVADDPNNLYIPAGWTVVSFGTNDRGALNTKTRDYIETLPNAMLDDTVGPMYMTYDHQPAWFGGVTALDDDPTTAGVNVVVEYNGTFTLPTNITAQWRKMFDDADVVINEVEMLDYKLEIFQDDALLETITYTWDDVDKEYTASGEQTVIDTSEFGSGYLGVYSALTPKGAETTAEIDIVIGVMPPKFAGVANRYIDEKTYVDLLEGISADDGYGNDLTDSIIVTKPAGLNIYSPEPGTYEIGLEFTHHVHFDGIESVLTYSYDGTDYNRPWNPETNLNADFNINTNCSTTGSPFCAWNDLTHFRDATSGWGSVIVVLAADNTIKEIYNRYNWEHTTSEGVVVGDLNLFTAWQAALTLEPGEFVLGAHGSVSAAAQWRYMAFGDPMTLVVGTPDFDYDIVTNSTYTLVVDDKTAPVALIVNNKYQINQGEYTNVNDAILANVVAFDNFDQVDDLAIYVSDNGGLMLNTPGVYDVEVTVEDMAGNYAVVEFSVKVVAVETYLTEAEIELLIQAMIDDIDMLTEEEVEVIIQAMIDDQVLTQTEIEALIAAGVISLETIQGLIDDIDLLTDEEVQTMIDEAIDDIPAPEVTGCGATTGIIPGFGIMGIIALLGAAIVFFRRQR